ncbi:cytochrome P450 [Ramaria rubella]|nr:cytochrome P450 [Ramaria rubella]
MGTPGFFVAPYRFLQESRSSCRGSWFRFGVPNKSILVAFGEDARKAIYTNTSFSSSAGYAVFSPAMDDMIPDNKEEVTNFNWFFRRVIRTETIQNYLPNIMVDIECELIKWGRQGSLNPFVDLRKLVFLSILRITLGDEIVNYPEKVNQTIDAFQCIDKGSTPDTLLLPWFPTPARLRRLFAGIKLYRLFSEAIKVRRLSGKHQQDILQTILDEEDRRIDDKQAAQFLIMSIFTAGHSSSMVFPWVHVHLDQSPVWKAKVLQEVDTFVHEYSSGTLDTLTQDLMAVSLSSWENSLPSLDLCLRETLRLTLINTVPRRNTGSNIKLGAHVVHRGDAVMYMTADVHLDPLLYPDPLRFDPGRSYEHNVELSFLGWGAGTHACIGQRLAKIITKVTTVLLLSHLALEGINQEDSTTLLPQSQLFGMGPPIKPFFLKYASRPDKV